MRGGLPRGDSSDWFGMSKRKIIISFGLQRSGNHAVLDWVGSLFPGAEFHNDQDHDLFANLDALRATIQESSADCIVFSFEDSVVHAVDPTVPLMQDVSPFPEEAFPDFEVHRIYILRDPYNTWASRIAANDRAKAGGSALTSDPSWEFFRTNWLTFAQEYQTAPETVILFNRWRSDAAYRQKICAHLGGEYSEATLNQIAKQGFGSSFDGMPRPSYSGMLAQLPKYTSAAFLKRLASKPGHYIRRFFTPPATADRLNVEERWRFLLGRPEGKNLFEDENIRTEAQHIFKLAFDPSGEPLKSAANR